MKKISHLFYRVKYKDDYKITRILFFKFKEKLPSFDNKEAVLEQKNVKKVILSAYGLKHVGKCSYTQPDLYVANPDKTTVGAFCSFGWNVVLGHGEHPQNFLSSSPYLYLDILGYKDESMKSHNEFLGVCPESCVWGGF